MSRALSLFVTGTDTEIGKTLVSAALLRGFAREGLRAAAMKPIAAEACQRAGVAVSDLSVFVPHQANLRIIEAIARKLGVPRERVADDIVHAGNTSSASIPLALSDAVADRRIKRGDLLLLEAMGGGFTWGSALVRF